MAACCGSVSHANVLDVYCSNCSQPVLRSAYFCASCRWPTGDACPEPAGARRGAAAPVQAVVPGDERLAGIWVRFLASSIDSGLVLLGIIPLFLSLFLIVTRAQPGRLAAGALLLGVALATLAALWLYYAGQESSRHQATVGKRALGLAVTDLQGHQIDLGRATGRFLGKFLSAIPFYGGYLLAAVTRRKQALHDLMAGTCVVQRRPASPGVLALGWAIAIILMVVGGALPVLMELQRQGR